MNFTFIFPKILLEYTKNPLHGKNCSGGNIKPFKPLVCHTFIDLDTLTQVLQT